MERQMEKWHLERAILLAAVREVDPATPGYSEALGVLLGVFIW